MILIKNFSSDHLSDAEVYRLIILKGSIFNLFYLSFSWAVWNNAIKDVTYY